MVKLQKTTNKKDQDRYFITVPKDMVLKKGWGKGEDLIMIFNERGNVEIADDL